MGVKVIFLDDGFRFNFKKLNILLQPKLEPYFDFCIPSGAYREHKSAYKKADILAKEANRLRTKSSIALSNPKNVTSYSYCQSLTPQCPFTRCRRQNYFKDHSYFDKSKILEEYARLNATSLLVTQKDATKLEEFGLPLSILHLEMQIDPTIQQKIQDYIAKES